MMGLRTSVYLTEELADRVKRCGLPVGVLIQLGLDSVDEKLANGWRLVPSGGVILIPPGTMGSTDDSLEGGSA